jgi:proteasome lid subunit RPN8/RPN11
MCSKLVTMLAIKKNDLQGIYDHCNRAYPNEACGILAGQGGLVECVYRMTNAEPSADFFIMDPQEQFAVMKKIRQEGLLLIGIYHSHTKSPAYPSSKDVSLAYYPEAVYLIITLMDRTSPLIKGYTIVGGCITEVPLDIITEA